MQLSTLRSLALAISPVLLATSASAAPWREIVVPRDHATIQAALDASTDGDTISVEPGTYFETLDFLGKAVHLRSVGGPGSTMIDGTGREDPLVWFRGGEGRDSILEGFTLQNGHRHLPDGRLGGAVDIRDSEPTIRGNVFFGNTAYRGGAIHCYAELGQDARPLIEGNLFERNTATQSGGSIHAEQSSVVLRSNQHRRCNARQAGRGGAVALIRVEEVDIEGCSYVDCSADFGAAVYILGSTRPGRVEDSTFLQSRSGFPGYSLYATSWEGTISRCRLHLSNEGRGCLLLSPLSSQVARVEDSLITYTDHYGIRTGGPGKTIICGTTIYGTHASRNGLALWDGETCVENSIIASKDNSNEVEVQPPARFEVAYSNIPGGQFSVDGQVTWGPGMVETEPGFVDVGGQDFRLNPQSPCIDAADPLSLPLRESAGRYPRLLDGNADGVLRQDIGAFEYSVANLSAHGDLAPGSTVTVDLDGLPGLPTFLMTASSSGLVETTFGAVLLDVSQGLSLRGWPSAPSTVQTTLPSGFPDDMELHLQALVLHTPSWALSNRELLETP